MTPCKCKCMRLCIYTYVYIYIYIYMYICTYVCTFFCVSLSIYAYTYIYICTEWDMFTWITWDLPQNSAHATYSYQVATTCRMPYLCMSLSTKEPYNEWFFLRKMTCNLRPPMGLRYPVRRMYVYIQPIAFSVSLYSLLYLECHWISISNLQSQSRGSFFNDTWQERPTERDQRFGSENVDMKLQMK
jgi:hypothetical protein